MPVYDVEDEEEKLGVVSSMSLQEGLEKMSLEYPEHFSRCFEEVVWDAEDADVFFQFITMGEVVYG